MKMCASNIKDKYTVLIQQKIRPHSDFHNLQWKNQNIPLGRKNSAAETSCGTLTGVQLFSSVLNVGTQQPAQVTDAINRKAIGLPLIQVVVGTDLSWNTLSCLKALRSGDTFTSYVSSKKCQAIMKEETHGIITLYPDLVTNSIESHLQLDQQFLIISRAAIINILI